MPVYGFTMCSKCLGFGLGITTIERMQIIRLMCTAEGMSRLRTMPLFKDEPRDICGSCIGTGWQLTESKNLRYNSVPINTIKRW